MNIFETFVEAANQHLNKPAIIFNDNTLSYCDLFRKAFEFSHILRTRGIEPGDVLINLTGNTPEMVISMLGCMRSGITFANINPLTKPDQLHSILDNCKPAIIVVNDISQFLDLKRPYSALAFAYDMNVNVKVHGSHTMHDGSELCSLVYTSGSTGEPKGVMCPHENMMAAIESINEYLGHTKDDVVLNVLPLSHGYGMYQVLCMLAVGGTVVLEKSIMDPGPGKILEDMKGYQITGLPIVPSMVPLFFDSSFIKDKVPSLRYITSAAMAMPVKQIRKIRELLPSVDFIQMYGLTECVRALYLPAEWMDIKAGAAGISIPGCDVYLIDDEGNIIHGADEKGELVVHGPNVMAGYLNNPDKTKIVFHNQWFGVEDKESQYLYTGDIFFRDPEGFYHFVGRNDDQIKIAGEKVSLSDLDRYLCNLDGIEQAAVVQNTTDDKSELIAHVVINWPCVIAISEKDIENQIKRQCLKDLGRLMVPNRVVFWHDSLPHNTNGKVNRNMLALRRNQ